jgi:TPR repeat protein
MPYGPGAGGLKASHDELAMLQKAADAGLPAAQLALAQFYLSRRAGPQDLVNAYMWYQVATERASQARRLISKILPPLQIEEAQNEASSRLARLKGTVSAIAEGQTQSTPDLDQEANGPTHG